MPTNFPTSIDSFTDPTPTNPMNAPSHAGEHDDANDAIVAIETAVGTTSAPNYLPVTGGTMSGAIAMGSNKVTGLANGSASSDAAAFGQIPTLASQITGAMNLETFNTQECEGDLWVGGEAYGAPTLGVVSIQRPFNFNGFSQSAADPGSGNFGVNSTSMTLSHHLYISFTDANSNDETQWILDKALATSPALIVSDGTDYFKVTVTSVTNHSTWADVGVNCSLIGGTNTLTSPCNLYDFYLFSILGNSGALIFSVADVNTNSTPNQTVWSLSGLGSFNAQITLPSGIVWENVNGISGSEIVFQTKNVNYTLTGQDSFLLHSALATVDHTFTFPSTGLVTNTFLVIRNDNTTHNVLFSNQPAGCPAGLGPGQCIGMIITGNGSPPTATMLFDNQVGTAAWAAVTSPTLGAAAQLTDKYHDADLYIDVTTAGQITIAIGPTSGVAHTLFNDAASGVGYTVHLPAGWYVAVTTSSTAVWSATAVTSR